MNIPAFPVLIVDRQKELEHFNGMTLRDYFAAKAMSASESLCVELENQGINPNMARDALRQAKRTIWGATGKKYDKKTTA